MTQRNHIRFAAVVGLTSALALLGGCGVVDDVLTVENPSQVPITDLDNISKETLIPILVNGAIGDFTHMYDDPFIWRGSMLTDEQVTGINWEQTARLNLRIVQFKEGDADLMFGSISRALRQAGDGTAKLRTLVDTPNADRRLATTLAFTGYSYVVMGEAMCQAIVSTFDWATGIITPGDHFLTPDSLFQRALPALQEAVAVATAANDTSILNLARVGLARAYLSLNDKANTKIWAALVPLGFKYTLEFAGGSAPARQNNTLWTRVTGPNHALGMSPWFLQTGNDQTPMTGGLPFGEQKLKKYESDPRIQHTSSWTYGHNALTKLYKPYQGLRFTGYTGKRLGNGVDTLNIKEGTDVKLFEQATGIVLADYVEAQHDLAEADGPTAATVAFINARRAVGFQPALTLVPGVDDAAIMAELRNQRARDLFMGGFRLPDLRRWTRFDPGNGPFAAGSYFPTGTHPNPTWGQYGPWTCFPIPIQEYEGNENLQRPINPNVPPSI